MQCLSLASETQEKTPGPTSKPSALFIAIHANKAEERHETVDESNEKEYAARKNKSVSEYEQRERGDAKSGQI